MSEPIDNRTGDRYSSAMKTQAQPITLPLDTTVVPAHWVHMDDDTPCDRHLVCPRPTYVRGGRPNWGSADQ